MLFSSLNLNAQDAQICDGAFLNDKQILQSTSFLLAGGSSELLSEKVLQKLAEIGNTSVEKLNNPAVLNKIISRIKDEKLSQEVAGEQIFAAKKMMDQSDVNLKNLYNQESGNALKGWGWELLPRNDKAFNDPTYLAKLVKQSDATAVGMQTMDPNNVRELFNSELQVLAPNLYVEAFVQTGSDANNLFYDVANSVASRHLNKKVRDAEILYFDGVYGGVRGRIADAGMMRNNLDEYKIVSPHTAYWLPTNSDEILRLEELEDKAISQIKEKFENSEKPIGGILFESILGAKGVYFYRPEFVTKLRNICDELKIPILADEVLTGGGRTGKFFAFEHYEGFEPDFVSFGKGLQVSGLASYHRPTHFSYGSYNNGPVTNHASTEGLLKGAQVMKRIRVDKLMENAQETGKYLVQKLKKLANTDDPEQIRGMGLLIADKTGTASEYLGYQYAFGRLTPPMTLTKKEIENSLKKNKK